MSKPTIIFVPGAWHGPEAFGQVMTLLKKAGYSCVAVALPSVGAMPPLKDFSEDVKAIRRAVEKESSQGRNSIVVMHSYGSLPACDAVKGLTIADKQDGAVVKLLFICSFVLPEGSSLLGTALQGQPLPWFDIKGDEVYPKDPGTIFYNDLDDATKEQWTKSLAVHSYPTMSSEMTYAAWQHCPSAYLLCENDNAIPFAAQQGMVQSSGMASETCTAGHSPFLSQPDFVADFIGRQAGEGV